MPNINISHLNASGWVALQSPIPCDSLVVESADTAYGFLVRSPQIVAGQQVVGDQNTERPIGAGCGVRFDWGYALQPDQIVAFVKALSPDPVLIVTAGMSLQISIVPGSSASNLSSDSMSVAETQSQNVDQSLSELSRIRRLLEIFTGQEVGPDEV